MAAKRKPQDAAAHIASQASKHRMAQARQAHAKGTLGMEDYIWTAMQCYAADMRNQPKTPGRFI